MEVVSPNRTLHEEHDAPELFPRPKRSEGACCRPNPVRRCLPQHPRISADVFQSCEQRSEPATTEEQNWRT